MTQRDIKPEFEVHEVDEDDRSPSITTEYVKAKGKDYGSFVQKEEPSEERQFDVYFPHGHSIRIIGIDELKARGFAGDPNLVDMDTGDIEPPQRNVSLRTHSERVTKKPKHAGAAATG